MVPEVDRICRLLGEANEILEMIDGEATDEQTETLARVDALISHALREAERLVGKATPVGV
jgi:hypothetical protein